MPYFDPPPTGAELSAWLFPNGQPHKVPRWPRPNSNRVDSRFRLKFTNPIDDNTASRYLFFHLRDNPPGGPPAPRIGRWGWFDIEVFLDQVLLIELAPDFDNLILEIRIEPSEPLTHEPDDGIEVFVTSTIPGFGGAEMVYDWGVSGPRPWRYNVQMNSYPFTSFAENAIQPWPWFFNTFRMFGVTDCYTFPRIP